MKIGETLFILAMVGLCRAGKLLKTPRIYNAFVTSDEKLQPSQAYPAIAPVVQGIQYPIPSYVAPPSFYHPFLGYPTFNMATTTGGRSFSYAVKQDYVSYNYFENDAAFAGKVPVIPDPAQSAILTPAGLQPLPKELPYPSSEARADTKTQYQDEQQQGDEEQNRDDYPDQNPEPVHRGHPQKNAASRNRDQTKQLQQEAHAQQEYDNSDSADDTEEPETESEHDQGSYLPINSLVKNNRPKDSSIVDVPPDPLPIGKSKGKKKKPEEYPLSPLGFPF